MKLCTKILLVLCFFASPLWAVEFKVEGEDAGNFKFSLDLSGLDRSTPENVVQAFLVLANSLRIHEAKLDAIYYTSLEKLLKPLLSEKIFQSLLGSLKKKMEVGKKILESLQFSNDFSFPQKKENPDGSVELFYKHTSTISALCTRCEGKRMENPCRSCKGKGRREEKQEHLGKMAMAKKGQDWYIREAYQHCYYCDEKGQCLQCKGEKEEKGEGSGERAPGEEKPICPNCQGKKICLNCKGTAYIKDRSISSSRTIYKGLTPYAVPSMDTSTPENTFKAFQAVSMVAKNTRDLMKSKIIETQGIFLSNFMEKHTQKSRNRNADNYIYTLGKIEKSSEEKTTIEFTRESPGDSKYKRQSSLRQILLIKEKDGWKIDQILIPCHRCDGKGVEQKVNTVYICPTHGQAKYEYTKNGPQCSECKSPMKSQEESAEGKKCETCSGSGKREAISLYDSF